MSEFKIKYIEDQRGDDEVFMYNVKVGAPLCRWEKPFSTLRRGVVAVDVYGNILPDYVPVFIHESEHEAYIEAWIEEIR